MYKRQAVIDRLRQEAMDDQSAIALADRWLVQGDFLLAPLAAVSYTHLDVYKRQEQGLAIPMPVGTQWEVVAAAAAPLMPCLLYPSRCV